MGGGRFRPKNLTIILKRNGEALNVCQILGKLANFPCFPSYSKNKNKWTYNPLLVVGTKNRFIKF